MKLLRKIHLSTHLVPLICILGSVCTNKTDTRIKLIDTHERWQLDVCVVPHKRVFHLLTSSSHRIVEVRLKAKQLDLNTYYVVLYKYMVP